MRKQIYEIFSAIKNIIRQKWLIKERCIFFAFNHFAGF